MFGAKKQPPAVPPPSPPPKPFVRNFAAMEQDQVIDLINACVHKHAVTPVNVSVSTETSGGGTVGVFAFVLFEHDDPGASSQ